MREIILLPPGFQYSFWKVSCQYIIFPLLTIYHFSLLLLGFAVLLSCPRCRLVFIYFETELLSYIDFEDVFRSVAQSCPTLCDPMNRSMPGLPVHHQLPEFTETHVHRVSDTIQPSHPLSSPSPPAPNPSQHQSLFQWVNSSHEVAKVLEFQL